MTDGPYVDQLCPVELITRAGATQATADAIHELYKTTLPLLAQLLDELKSLVFAGDVVAIRLANAFEKFSRLDSVEIRNDETRVHLYRIHRYHLDTMTDLSECTKEFARHLRDLEVPPVIDQDDKP